MNAYAELKQQVDELEAKISSQRNALQLHQSELPNHIERKKQLLEDIAEVDKQIRESEHQIATINFDAEQKLQDSLKEEMDVIYTKEKSLLLSKLSTELTKCGLTLNHLPNLSEHLVHKNLFVIESKINRIIFNLPFIKELVDDLIWDQFPDVNEYNHYSIKFLCASKTSIAFEEQGKLNYLRNIKTSLTLLDIKELLKYIPDNKDKDSIGRYVYWAKDKTLIKWFGWNFISFIAKGERNRRHLTKQNEFKLSEDIMTVWNGFNLRTKDYISSQFLSQLSTQTNESLPEFILSLIASDNLVELYYFTYKQVRHYCRKRLIDVILEFNPKCFLRTHYRYTDKLCTNEQLIPLISISMENYLKNKPMNYPYLTQEFTDLNLIYESKELKPTEKLAIFSFWKKIQKGKNSHEKQCGCSGSIAVLLKQIPVIITLTYTLLKSFLASLFGISEDGFITIIIEYTLSCDNIYIDPINTSLANWFEGKLSKDILLLDLDKNS